MYIIIYIISLFQLVVIKFIVLFNNIIISIYRISVSSYEIKVD